MRMRSVLFSVRRRRCSRCCDALGTAARRGVKRGGRRQRDRVGLRDEVGEVGKGLRGGGVEQRPVGAEGGGGGGGDEAGGAGGEGGGGEGGGRLAQQHLEDVVDNVTGAGAALSQVIF